MLLDDDEVCRRRPGRPPCRRRPARPGVSLPAGRRAAAAGDPLVEGLHLLEEVVQDRHETGGRGVLERVDEDAALRRRVLIEFFDDLGNDRQGLRADR